MSKVLMVDDVLGYCRSVGREVNKLDPDVVFLVAHRLQTAWELFLEHKDTLDLIVMDGQVDEPLDNTYALVRKIREAGFTGRMIAASSGYNTELMTAGCDVYGNTMNLAPQIVKLLSP